MSVAFSLLETDRHQKMVVGHSAPAVIKRIRGKDGYKYEGGASGLDPARLGRLHILEVQRLIRFMPKVVIAVVPGWAVGGGHSLHVVCDLTIASREHAVFKQTDPDVASFDSGYGSALLARQVGQKKAREIFFLGHNYNAEQSAAMGMVNLVVDHENLEKTALEWAKTINSKVRLRCVCSNTASTFLTTEWLVNSSSPVKLHGWPMEPTRLKKDEMRFLRNVIKIIQNSPGTFSV